MNLKGRLQSLWRALDERRRQRERLERIRAEAPRLAAAMIYSVIGDGPPGFDVSSIAGDGDFGRAVQEEYDTIRK